MVIRPAAVVDQRGALIVEPALHAPARAPHDGAVRDIGDLGVVAHDQMEHLGDPSGVALRQLVPIDGVVLGFGKHPLEHAFLDAVAKVAIQLTVIAPNAQVVHKVGENDVHVQRFLVIELLPEDVVHERVAGICHAGVAAGLVAARVFRRADAKVCIAMDGATVAAVGFDGVLLCFRAQHPGVGDQQAALAHGVDLARFRLAGLDRTAFGLRPVQAIMSVPTAAFVVILGPFLLGRRHHVVVVRADKLAKHVVGKIGHSLRVLHVYASVAFDDESLAFLRSHHCAKACAGGMVSGVHDARIGK